MAITAAMVKDLREKTGVGMMDCKKALVESGGDEEKAIAYLREKGLSKAAKKAGRATSEGVVGCFVSADGKTATLAELMCETDFVAKGEEFQAFAADLAEKLAGMDVTSGTAADLPAEMVDVTGLIAKLGENMGVGRFVKTTVDGVVGIYIHSNKKIGVLVALEGTDNATVGKDIAMQVAASNPVCVASDELPQNLLEQEKDIYRKQGLEEGKPAEIVEKIVMGRVNKYYKEVCLLEQPFIKDDKKSIKQYLKETAGGAKVLGFTRLALGEGAPSSNEE
ncbi:MAG: translation elongation factor Ts [Proteobacteria bacterium]|nr:translation elongation factor Ts [Pseudomonadota bacterium]